MYGECSNGMVRFTYPYDIAPANNPLFIRVVFNLIDSALNGNIDDMYDEVKDGGSDK